MDKINRYKKIVREILEVLATRIPVNTPTIKKRLVINADQSEFILISVGQRQNAYHYNVLAHLAIKDDKIFIYAESIDPSFYERLTDKGIPESDILPVYLPDFELAAAVVTV